MTYIQSIYFTCLHQHFLWCAKTSSESLVNSFPLIFISCSGRKQAKFFAHKIQNLDTEISAQDGHEQHANRVVRDRGFHLRKRSVNVCPSEDRGSNDPHEDAPEK